MAAPQSSRLGKQDLKTKNPPEIFPAGLWKRIILRLGDNRGALRVVFFRRNLVGFIAHQQLLQPLFF